MRYLFSLLILFSLFSCGNSSYHQKNALKKVGDFYGGNITTSAGFTAHNTSNKNYFRINIKNSPLINDDVDNTTLHAGNIAYLIYTNLEGTKNEYDEINVNIDLANNETRSFTYPTNQLEQIHKMSKTIDEFNSLIIRKDYKGLTSILNKEIMNDEKFIPKLFEKLHSDFGNIKQIQYQGFEFQNDEKHGEYVLNKQVISFEKQNVNMYISVSPKDNLVVGIFFP